jgi:hypothetical protein
VVAEAVAIHATDIIMLDLAQTLSSGERWAAASVVASAAVPPVDLVAVAPAIGVALAVAADSTVAVPAVVGNSAENSESTFFPMDCLVPLQIP